MAYHHSFAITLGVIARLNSKSNYRQVQPTLPYVKIRG